MSLNILIYFQQEWKRLHDEFEKFVHHGVTPPAVQAGQNQVAGPSAGVQQSPAILPPGSSVPTPQFGLTSNPYTAYLAKYGDHLWAVEKGENLTIDKAGYAQALAAGFSKNVKFEEGALAGNPQLLPDTTGFDPSRTTINAAEDHGKLFKAQPGTTTYTVIGPADLNLIHDSTEVPGGWATYQIDNGQVLPCIETGPIGSVSTGPHPVVVNSNMVMTFQVQAKQG